MNNELKLEYDVNALAGFDIETSGDVSAKLREARAFTIDEMVKWAMGEVAVDGIASPIDAADHLIRNAANARYYGLNDLPSWDIPHREQETHSEATVALLVQSAIACMAAVRIREGSTDPTKQARHDIAVLKDRIRWSEYRRTTPRNYANRAGVRVLMASKIRLS